MHRSGHIALCRSDIKHHLLLLDNEGCLHCLILTSKIRKCIQEGDGFQKYILLVNVELQLKKEETIQNPALYSGSSVS